METCKDQQKQTVDISKLADLGFTKAAKTYESKKALAKKLMLAYEHYRFVTPAVIEKFNKALEKKTWKKNDSTNRYPTYDQLNFDSIGNYGEIPPANVLEDVKKAKDMGIFDTFEVATIKSVEVRPDPIIFGRINECGDRFFISQWDNDVRIEDILGENEG